jgi:UPF0716 protein FxsA
MSGAWRMAARRRVPWWVLALLFDVLPVVEIYVLIRIGQTIGAWWTVLLLIGDGVLGSWLMKHQGSRAWAALTTALRSGRMPAKELADAGLILVGGTLLLTPGFVSDIFGLFLVLPFTRPIARRMLTGYLTRRFLLGAGGVTAGAGSRSGTRSSTTGAGQSPGPDGVNRGEVID